jgi:glucose/arabinose dehydrogenase
VGLRNPAGLAVHPGTGALWASQNERDHLGDDLPPEELNVLTDGRDFGWPECYGQGIPNPEYDDLEVPCDGAVPPALEMQAHSAPLGMAFYTGDAFPEAYHGDLFLAFHGSWNRSVPTGYKLVRVRVEDGRPVGLEDFATGWLGPRGQVRGRPAYPVVTPDGSLLLSDDGSGRIWRFRYEGGS